MAKDDYLPKTEPELRQWITLYKEKINKVGVSLGLSPEQIAAQQKICDDIVGSILNTYQLKHTLKGKNEAKHNLIKQTLPVLRKMVKQYKFSPTYSTDIGKGLGVEGAEIRISHSEASTVIKAQTFPKMVKIIWRKKHIDGVNIYGRLQGEPFFKLLGRDTKSPYFDTRALADGKTPEIREYMARAVFKDEEAGKESNIVTVVFGG